MIVDKIMCSYLFFDRKSLFFDYAMWSVHIILVTAT